MKCVLQRVSEASVRVEDETVGAIGRGICCLLGVIRGDGEREARRLAERVARFRFFPDEAGKMNLSALDAGLEVLVISQFTLAADGRRGRRPSFDRAAPPELAEPLYELFCTHLRDLGLRVETGRFAAMMQVGLINDGPVTFVLEESSDGPPEAPKP